MNQEILDRKLRSIGKEIFVEYFEDFKDLTIDREKLALKLLKENPKATSLGAQQTRISNARKIFELKMEKEALFTIIESNRLNDNIRAKAKKIAKNI